MAYDYPMNFSNGTNAVTGFGSLLQYGEYVTSGLLGTAFITLIFVITLVISMAAGAKKALLSSSFITLIFSVYFMRIEMVNPLVPFALLLIVIFLVISPDKSGGQPY